jgi:hypothetical protein
MLVTSSIVMLRDFAYLSGEDSVPGSDRALSSRKGEDDEWLVSALETLLQRKMVHNTSAQPEGKILSFASIIKKGQGTVLMHCSKDSRWKAILLRKKGIPKDRNGKRADGAALKRTVPGEPQNEIGWTKSKT